MIVPGIGDFLELAVILRVAGLRTDHRGFHAEQPQGAHQRKRLERAADVDRRLFADELLLVALQFGIDRGDFFAHQIAARGS